MQTFTAIDHNDFEDITCCNCGMMFFVPRAWKKQLRKTGGGFHCPAGHSLVFNGETEEERLKRQLARKSNDLELMRLKKNSAVRSRDAHKGHVTRIKNRVSNGVCPCCNRQFKDLHRHMEGQHPDWTSQDIG